MSATRDISVELCARLVRLLEQANEQGVAQIGEGVTPSRLVEFAMRHAPAIQSLVSEIAGKEHQVLDGKELAELLRINYRDIPLMIEGGMPYLELPGKKRPVKKFIRRKVLEWAEKNG